MDEPVRPQSLCVMLNAFGISELKACLISFSIVSRTNGHAKLQAHIHGITRELIASQ